MKYYIRKQGITQGPFSISQLIYGGVLPSSYVWCKGMPDWTQARNVPEICTFYRNRLFEQQNPPLEGGRLIYNRDLLPEGEKVGNPANAGTVTQVAGSHNSTHSFGNGLRGSTTSSPSYSYLFPYMVSILFFFPLGIPALMHARKASKLRRKGMDKEAVEEGRQAKMLGGIALFLGLAISSFLFRSLF